MQAEGRYNQITLRVAEDALARDVRRTLTAPVKSLPCKYFYDAAGSELFERICELPEYYLTRVETAILRRDAHAIVAACPADVSLVELGCGNSRKTRHLIEAVLARQRQLVFYGIDIAPECLQKGAQKLLHDYATVQVVGLVGEFADGLSHLAGQPGGPRLVAFLGSTIGNFDEQELAEFFGMLSRTLRPADRFLLGVDLLKDHAVLEAAYDDAQGVTAQFNLNLLARLNRELDAQFDLSQFHHRAIFNAERGRIEMHLVSQRDQRVRFGKLDIDVVFGKGEMIHTENCYKYSIGRMTERLAEQGLEVTRTFTDEAGMFGVLLVSPSIARRAG